METQHTPGPWKKFNPLTPKTDDRIHQAIKGTGGEYIAYVPITKDFYTAEQNAALISAAPELLEALEKVLRYASLDEASGLYGYAMSIVSKAKGKGER